MVGNIPFYGENMLEIYERILIGNPPFPIEFSKHLSDFIRKLLNNVQSKRLGKIKSGISTVIKHKWFGSFDWSALESGQMTPPFIPAINGPGDISNFGEFDEGGFPVKLFIY